MTEPKRLLDTDDLPASLREALHALESREPDAAAVARVQRSLEVLPPITGGRGRFGFTALRTLAIVAAAALGALFMLRSTHQPNSAAAGAVMPAHQPEAAPSLPLSAAPVAQPASEIPAAPLEFSNAHTAPHARKPVVREPAAPSKQAHPSVPALRAQERSVSVAASEPVSAATAIELHAVPAQPAARAPQQVSEPPGPEPTDEAGLLFRAKRLAVHNPSAALRLLESHSFYFPNGTFVQEREVLAIQLHRQLGHTDKAHALAERFRAHFPNSVYRSAVAP